MTRHLSLRRSGTCCCGAPLSKHFDRDGSFISCDDLQLSPLNVTIKSVTYALATTRDVFRFMARLKRAA